MAHEVGVEMLLNKKAVGLWSLLKREPLTYSHSLGSFRLRSRVLLFRVPFWSWRVPLFPVLPLMRHPSRSYPSKCWGHR